jgi:NADPH:quinone reductase-like Zn-dependent oxidoreductase
LGVDEPIDYATTKFEDVARDIDVVFDTQGGDTQQRSWKVLKKGRVLVSVVQPPPEEEAAKHGVKSVMFRRQPNTGELAEIGGLIDSVA